MDKLPSICFIEIGIGFAVLIILIILLFTGVMKVTFGRKVESVEKLSRSGVSTQTNLYQKG